ncbi:hypothetical protein IG631_18886 [Alternaria alternata]|nr:hypothetical protein IG631_18886 [Alternaria alternata]
MGDAEAPNRQSVSRHSVSPHSRTHLSDTFISDEDVCEILRIACTKIAERAREDPMRAQIFWYAGTKITKLQQSDMCCRTVWCGGISNKVPDSSWPTTPTHSFAVLLLDDEGVLVGNDFSPCGVRSSKVKDFTYTS